MSAIDQYTDLYRQNAATFDANSSEALNRRRPEALAQLPKGTQLPTKRTEGYERTSIEDMYAPDFGLNPRRLNMPVDIASAFRCAVPHMSTLLGVTVNDSFHPVGSLDSKLPEGVTFMSLARAAREFPETVDRYYNSLAPADDKAVALNTLLVQDGVFIHIGRGVNPGKPLQLVNILSSPVPLMAPRRMLIVVDEDATLDLLVCDHTADNTTRYLANTVAELVVSPRARVNICSIEESSPLTSRHCMLHASQLDGSELNLTTVTLLCGTTRNDYRIDLNGEHCSTRLSGMAIGDGKMHIDNDTAVNHRSPRCKSDQLFKYVLDNESSGAFEGSILVTGYAPFTEAYQSNRNVLASQGATMHSKPVLEIYNDEVKCSHGATTGQLDQAALFYMQTRGIPLDEARSMLMQAFMTDVIDRVAIDGLRDRLRHLVERRFSMNRGDSFTGQCSDCHAENANR